MNEWHGLEEGVLEGSHWFIQSSVKPALFVILFIRHFQIPCSEYGTCLNLGSTGNSFLHLSLNCTSLSVVLYAVLCVKEMSTPSEVLMQLSSLTDVISSVDNSAVCTVLWS